MPFPFAAGETLTAANLNAALNQRMMADGTGLAFPPGGVIFGAADGKFATDTANLFFDNTNDRLGIRTNTPQAMLHVGKTAATARSYNSYTDTANGEWGYLGDWAKAAGVLTYGSDKNGTGVIRDVSLVRGGTEQIRLTATGLTGPAASGASVVPSGTTGWAIGSGFDPTGIHDVNLWSLYPVVGTAAGTVEGGFQFRQKLAVAAAGGLSTTLGFLYGNAGFSEFDLYLNDGSDATAYLSIDPTYGFAIGATGAASLNFLVDPIGVAVTIASTTGNLGIGTTTPQALLHVGKTAATARSYNAFADASNSEWAYMGDWSLVANTATYGTAKNGTGLARDTIIVRGGIESIRIGVNGVGVGNGGAPVYPLQAYRADASLSASFAVIQNGTGDASIGFLFPGVRYWGIGVDNSDGKKFKINAAEDGFVTSLFTIDTAGNVGIGIASPTATLDVNGTFKARGNIATFSDGIGAADAQMRLGANRTLDGNSYIDLVGDALTYPTSGLRILRASGANGVSSLQHRGTSAFQISAFEAGSIELFTTNTRRVLISPTGSVAVASTAAPLANLHLGNASATARSYNAFTDASNGEWGYMGDWNSNVLRYGSDRNGTGVARNILFMIGGVNQLDFGVSNALGWTSASALKIASNAGSTDFSILNVDGVQYANAAKFGASFPIYLMTSDPSIGFNLFTNSLFGYSFGKGSTAHFGGVMIYSTSNGSYNFWSSNATGAANAAVTVAPVMATIGLTGTVIGAPTGGAKGVGTLNAVQVYGNNVLLTSDEREKTDIAPLPDDCLGLVRKIQPKTFRWRHPDLDRRNWGFVAQDVAAAMEAAGHEFGGHVEDDEGLQSLSYNDMMAVLWKAVQELATNGRKRA
jgi:Chaperone of endosialidase